MLKEYNIVIESTNAEWFFVTVPDIPGCVAKGKTIKEALINAKKSIEYYLEYPLEKCLSNRNFSNVNCDKLNEIKNLHDSKNTLSILVYSNTLNG